MIMDKRYGLILIIVIVCCINLFIVSNSSDVVGSAATECGNYTFAMPQGFTLYDSDTSHVLIHDSKTGMNINVYSNLGKSDTYDNKIKEIKSEGFTIVSNGTIKVGDIDVKSIYYTKADSTHPNRSTFFFIKDDNRFRILITDFDLDSDRNYTIDYVSDIINSIKYNYKK